MAVPILDALSNLSLDPETASGVTHEVLKTLQSAPISDLPIVIRFLLGAAGRVKESI